MKNSSANNILVLAFTGLILTVAAIQTCNPSGTNGANSLLGIVLPNSAQSLLFSSAKKSQESPAIQPAETKQEHSLIENETEPATSTDEAENQSNAMSTANGEVKESASSAKTNSKPEIDIATRKKYRLQQLSLFGGGTFGILCVLAMYFRANNATRGFYAGRLQYLTVAGIAIIFATCAAVGYYINWR